MNLEGYAINIWTLNKNDKNPNIPNKTVSPIEEININGVKAYSFNVDGSYVKEYAEGLLNEKNTLIFIANKDNLILNVQYPTANATSAKMLSTLVVDANLIAKKDDPSNWKDYNNPDLGFQFSYPSNIFISTDYPSDPNYLVSAIGKRGSIAVQLIDGSLDPQNIQGMYGKIDDAKIVQVGDRNGYEFLWGDAGCGATLVAVAISANKTARISFGACSEDLYPINQDSLLQKQILSTFKFKFPSIQTNDNFDGKSIKTYIDPLSTFSISYPSDFAPSNNLTLAQQKGVMTYMGSCPIADLSKDPNRIPFCYVGSQKSDGFDMASLTIISSTSTTPQDCQKSEPNESGPQAAQTVVTINGNTFYKNILANAGLGHYVSTQSYRTYRSGVCYTIDLKIESDRGTSEKGLSADFFNMMQAKLEAILATFKFTK